MYYDSIPGDLGSAQAPGNFSAILKGCLRYRTITSKHVSSEAQVNNFFYFVEE